MARPSGEKNRAGGAWTQARFDSFIKGNLRRTSQRWPPISAALKDARVNRGEYLCAGCKQIVPATIKNENGKRIKNAVVDHIEPVVDPKVGWVSWDSVVERMFVEKDGLQVLCHECHEKKSNEERALAKERRAGDKNEF